MGRIRVSSSVVLDSEKMMARFARVQKEKAREIFEAGRFNLELFQYVLDEYYKTKQEKEDREREEREEQEREAKEAAAEAEEERAAQTLTGRMFRAVGLSASGEKRGMIMWVFITLMFFIAVGAFGYMNWPASPIGTLKAPQA